MFNKFDFNDPEYCCSNCKFFSISDPGASEISKLDALSESTRQGQPINKEIGSCLESPPTFNIISVAVRGPGGAIQPMVQPVMGFPRVHKSRKCGKFEPKSFKIDTIDGKIHIVTQNEEYND